MCENLLFLKILKFINIAMQVIRLVVPILLIIKVILDIYKNMINPNSSEVKEKVGKRVLAAVIVFFVPTIIRVFMLLIENISGMKINYTECEYNIQNIAYLEEVRRIEMEFLDEAKKTEYLEKAKESLKKQAETIEKYKNTKVSDSTSRYVGQKYTLTESQLKGLCGVAISEQSSLEGTKAEASLMANLFEYKKKGVGGGDGLYNYVRTGGWFANAKKHMTRSCPSGHLAAVRDILVNGNRTLPWYVNEHDCWDCNIYDYCRKGMKGDICSIQNGSNKMTSFSDIKNRSNYKRDETIVRNVKGGVWVFYTFPSSTSDPFGYKKDAKEQYDSWNR